MLAFARRIFRKNNLSASDRDKTLVSRWTLQIWKDRQRGLCHIKRVAPPSTIGERFAVLADWSCDIARDSGPRLPATQRFTTSRNQFALTLVKNGKNDGTGW